MDNSELMLNDIALGLLTIPHVNSETGEVIISPVFPYMRSDTPADSLHTD